MGLSDLQTEFYLCSCGSEALSILWEPGDDELFLSMWEIRTTRIFDLKHRLKHIFQILRRGDPYEDQIVLTKEDALALANKILEIF